MPQSGQSGSRRVKKTATACKGVGYHSDSLQATEASQFQQNTRSTAATHGIYTVPNRGAICPETVHCHLQVVRVVHMLGTDMVAATHQGGGLSRQCKCSNAISQDYIDVNGIA